MATVALEPAVRATGLKKRFGYREALRGVDLEVPNAGCFAVFGPNGAGKSTLLKILCTRMRPSSGQLSILGLDALRSAGALRPSIGVVLHESFLRPDLTLEENLSFYAGLYGLPRSTAAERADALIHRFGLTPRATDLLRTFSQGMVKRAALIRSLLHDPRLWILDEPFAGLDPAGCALLEEVIAEERAARRSIVLVTHDTEAGLRLCDDCLLISGGAVAARGRREVEEHLSRGRRAERPGER
jgi:ABC-type multidrug transport system ATPase subunit